MVPLFVRKSGSKELLVAEVILLDFIQTRKSLKTAKKLVNQGLISKNSLKIGL